MHLSNKPFCLALALVAGPCLGRLGAAGPPPAPAPVRPTPLNASVMIFHEWGLRDVPALVERAARQGQRKVNFVVTIHCRLDKDLKVLDYGLIRAREGWHYAPFDEPLRTQFRRQLKQAFAKAVALKMD